MKAETALGLIEGLKLEYKGPQHWIDLGAGEGTFTKALATLLPEKSHILALDQSSSSLKKITSPIGSVEIGKHAGDFGEIPENLPSLDGIMMANAIHNVQNKEAFINSWKANLKWEASFLIIEYDTHRSNSWVPYPVKPSALKELFAGLGFQQFDKLGEIPSLYHNKIYAAQIRR